MAYKKLIKVSNVCQLLDKSLYFETKTVDGITYTNNGDGTITINGTNTKQSVVPIITNYKLYTSHFYIKRGRFSINWGYDIQTKDDFSLYKVTNDINNGAYYYLPVGTYNNVIDKPQLFDLTEMYGAGHEPTTVEEFRQDFPEEMYDYSPHCWLTSYKRVFMTGGGNYLTSYKTSLVCKTKNLFDINSYINLNNFSNITINGNSILCVARAANAHVSYKIPTVIGEKYTVSNKSIVKGGWVNTGSFGLFLSDNPSIDSSNYLTYGLQSGQSFTLTATSEFLYIHWYVCYNFDSNNPATIEINELQVELGDTATDYVPYGHL